MASLSSTMSSSSVSQSFEEKWAQQHRYNNSIAHFIRPPHEKMGDICVVHSHLSLTELKEGIRNDTLNDNRLLSILTRAQKDLETYKKWQDGIYDSDYCISHKRNKRELTDDESHLIHEAINEDEFIVEICKRELRHTGWHSFK
jgi:hypothetical protein